MILFKRRKAHCIYEFFSYTERENPERKMMIRVVIMYFNVNTKVVYNLTKTLENSFFLIPFID